MKQALLAVCAVIAIGVGGCTRFDADAEARAIEAQTEREFAPIKAAQEEANKRAEVAEKVAEACILAFPGLKIGDSEATVRSLLPCKPDHVNTTETANGYREQWVFETSSGVPSLGIGPSFMFLYFDNGKLVAKQI